MRWCAGITIVLTLAAAGCSRAPEPRRFDVRGQILAVDVERQEVLVKHDDIEGFMPAMTMPYRVEDPALLEGRQPGDLFTATLVVEEVSAYLSTLTATGHAALETAAEMPTLTDVDLLREGAVAPDTWLVDQRGAPFRLSSLRGHRLALTFIYTRCPLPDFCPLMDKHFAAVQRLIQQSPDLADVRLVSVTLDPEFDRPMVLAGHAGTLGADPALWYFLTGATDDVLAFAKRFGVTTDTGDADAPVVHNLRTAVIDAEGRLVTAHSGNLWTPAELVADIKKAPAPGR